MTALKTVPWLAIPLMILGCTSTPLWATTASALVPVPFFLRNVHAHAEPVDETPDAGATKR